MEHNLIKVLKATASEVTKEMDSDYGHEIMVMAEGIESGQVKGDTNIGNYLSDIIDGIGSAEYQEGVKLGMKVIWELYTSILEKDVPPSHAKLSFDTLAKAHLNVNRVNVE